MHRLVDAKRPVALFANGLGDHLLVLPALRALATLLQGRLTLVCMPGARETFFSDLPLQSVFEAEMARGTVRGERTFDPEAVASGVGGEADLLLSLNPWHSASVETLLQLLAPSHSVGFHSSFGTHLPLDYDKHSAELAFEVPRYLAPGLRLDDFAGPPALPENARRRARQLRSHVPTSMHVLAVHADTGPWTNGEPKMWPPERFRELLDAFLSRHPDFVAFVVGLEDLNLDSGRNGNRVVPCCGLPLDISLALVGEADLFIGIDSCMLHSADLYRIPGVGLFGPTNPQEFGFRFALHRHLTGTDSVACISVGDALGALESLMQTPST